MTRESEIRVEEALTCLLCGRPGNELYPGLADRLFGAPGKWGYFQCPQCGLVWLNPRPVEQDVAMAYGTYYTHAPEEDGTSPSILEKTKLALFSALRGYESLATSEGWRLLGKTLCLIPTFREVAGMGTMYLDAQKKGLLLEVGCGSGRFLSRMRKAGWDVRGVEPDSVAAQVAQARFGLPVFAGTLHEANFPERSFDAAALSHVIEHVYDPVGLLKECRRVLKPGGHLTLATPNVRGRAHQVFGRDYVGLDAPRHLFLFSKDTMRACAEQAGLRIDALRTSERHAWWIWEASRAIRRKGTLSQRDLVRLSLLRGMATQVREGLARRLGPDAGEEVLLLASRGSAPNKVDPADGAVEKRGRPNGK